MVKHPKKVNPKPQMSEWSHFETILARADGTQSALSPLCLGKGRACNPLCLSLLQVCLLSVSVPLFLSCLRHHSKSKSSAESDAGSESQSNASSTGYGQTRITSFSDRCVLLPFPALPLTLYVIRPFAPAQRLLAEEELATWKIRHGISFRSITSPEMARFVRALRSVFRFLSASIFRHHRPLLTQDPLQGDAVQAH